MISGFPCVECDAEKCLKCTDHSFFFGLFKYFILKDGQCYYNG